MVTSNKSDKLSNLFIHVLFILIVIGCVIPLILVVSISISDINVIYENGYRFFPTKLSLDSYTYILSDLSKILNAYGITILVTVLGGGLGLLVTAMLGYALGRSDYKYRKVLMFFVFFTMLFNGGLVPTYMIVTQVFKLKDTMGALILPMLANAWYILMMRTFMQGIPMELFEAAEVDGANQFRIFFTIVLPISKPALATIGLLLGLSYWNDWYQAMLYIDNEKLVPLQYLLYRIMANVEELAKNMSGMTEVVELPSETARMAMAVIAMGPIIFAYPFFQKYFEKGMTVGAVKG